MGLTGREQGRSERSPKHTRASCRSVLVERVRMPPSPAQPRPRHTRTEAASHYVSMPRRLLRRLIGTGPQVRCDGAGAGASLSISHFPLTPPSTRRPHHLPLATRHGRHARVTGCRPTLHTPPKFFPLCARRASSAGTRPSACPCPLLDRPPPRFLRPSLPRDGIMTLSLPFRRLRPPMPLCHSCFATAHP